MIKHIISFSIIVFILLAVIGTGVSTYAYIQLFGQQPVKTAQQLNLDNPFLFIRPGTTVTQLLDSLQAREGKKRDWRQSTYIKLNPHFSKIKFGSYQIKDNETIESLLQQIVEGKVVQLQVNLIPGQKLNQWRQTFANTKYIDNQLKELSDLDIAKKLGITAIDGADSLNNLEGYFLPSSYFYNYNGSDLEVLYSAYIMMVKVLDDAWSTRSPAAQVKNKYQLLTLASIIEKETNLNSEYILVSAVYNNRLKQGIRLQADPTLLYLKKDNNITRKDLTTDGPYNTYTRSGLPPTPINMPSSKAIYAAANPAKVDYIFMVAKGNEPGHTFSVTYQQHQEAVREYLKTLRK